MERSTLIYVLAFLLLLGGGAALIVPMLQGPRIFNGPPIESRPRDQVSPDKDADSKTTSETNATSVDVPKHTWPEIDVTIKRPGSDASGKLQVFGADLIGDAVPNSEGWTARLQPRDEPVWIAAPSAAWTLVELDELTREQPVVLKPASKPITVSLVEADGTPAADTPFFVRPGPAENTYRTNETGVAKLDHMPRGLIWIGASTMERSGASLRIDTTKTTSVTLALEPAWHIRGKAVDEAGNPISGAAVRVMVPGAESGRSVTTDKAGMFHWKGPAAARVALEVKRNGFVGHRIAVTPPAVGAMETDVGTLHIVERGFRLEGRVAGLDEIADARPRIEIEPAAAAVVADMFGAGHVVSVPTIVDVAVDGTFAADDLPADLPLRISLRGAGVDVDVRILGAEGATKSLELVAAAGETLSGAVLGPNGEPAAGQVLLFSHEPRDGNAMQSDDLRVVTDAEGRFHLSGVVDPRLFVRGYREGCRSLLETIDLPQETPAQFRMESALTDATRRVTGTVRDDEGKPLGGVRVQAAGVSTVSKNDGTYVLEGVESLAPQISLSAAFPLAHETPAGIEAASFSPAAVRMKPGTNPVDLKLARSATLKLRLLDGIDDAPIRFVHVVAQATKGGAVLIDRGVATADGSVTLAGLSPVAMNLSLMTHNRRLTKSITLRSGKTLDLGDVLMPHGFRVTGTVTDEAGKPLAGATVGALDSAWQTRGSDISKERELLFRSTVTDKQGRYSLEGLDPSEPAQIAYCALDFAPRAKKVNPPKDIASGINVTTDVKLSKGAFLVLELLHETAEGSGDGVFGALIDLEYARDGSDYLDVVHWGALGGPVCSGDGWRRASDLLLMEQEQDGLYIAGPLLPGPYDLLVSRPGFKRMHRRLTVMKPGAVIMRSSLEMDNPRLFGRSTKFRFELTPWK